MSYCDEEYELVEIFSQDQIDQKRAKVCTVCGRTVACCIWKSTASVASWKYCLDCQDDNFPEWHLEWNNYLSSRGIELSLSFRNHISRKCSKSEAFEIPYFPLSSSIYQRTKNDQSILKSDGLLQTKSVNKSDFTIPPSYHEPQDDLFSPHNDPLESPTYLEEVINAEDHFLETTDNTEPLISEITCSDLVVTNGEHLCQSYSDIIDSHLIF